jgi:hypothetical protein
LVLDSDLFSLADLEDLSIGILTDHLAEFVEKLNEHGASL